MDVCPCAVGRTLVSSLEVFCNPWGEGRGWRVVAAAWCNFSYACILYRQGLFLCKQAAAACQSVRWDLCLFHIVRSHTLGPARCVPQELCTLFYTMFMGRGLNKGRPWVQNEVNFSITFKNSQRQSVSSWVSLCTLSLKPVFEDNYKLF